MPFCRLSPARVGANGEYQSAWVDVCHQGRAAATEAWRQEFTRQSVRFSVVEPGATESELFDAKPGESERFTHRFGEVEKLHAEDIADAVAHIVTSPRLVAINEMVVRPTDQP